MKRRIATIFYIILGVAVLGACSSTNAPKTIAEVNASGKVSLSGSHILAVKNDGTVYASGSNEQGECDVKGWTDVKQVSAGAMYSVGLRKDGRVLATGDNSKGQCNVADWVDIVQVAAGSDITFGLKNDGTLVHTLTESVIANLPDDLLDSYQGAKERWDNLLEWTDIKQFSLASGDFAARLGEGTVRYSVTSDKISQNLKGSENWTEIKEVAIDYGYIIGLKDDESVVVEGENAYFGAEGVEQWNEYKIHDFTTDMYTALAVTDEGKVLTSLVPENYEEDMVPDNGLGLDVENWENIVTVDKFGSLTIGLKKNGRLVATGYNEEVGKEFLQWTDICNWED